MIIFNSNSRFDFITEQLISWAEYDDGYYDILLRANIDFAFGPLI
jgi:hypothetical protein